MDWHKLVSLSLWISPLVLLVAIAVLMIRRNLYRDFPVFFIYTIFQIAQFIVMFALLQLPSVTGNQYAYAFLAAMVLSIALRFGIIEEIIEGQLHLNPQPKRYLEWLKILLALAAIAFALYAPGENETRLTGGLAIVDRGVALIQCGLLAFLMCFSRFLALSWRGYSFGIAFGLGILAASDLANSALRANLSDSWNPILNLMTGGAYLVCVLVWLLYLLAPERKPAASLPSLSRDELEDWNRELQQFLRS